MKELTSANSPLRIDQIIARSGDRGWLGATIAPGKRTAGAEGFWRRDLVLDLHAARACGATLLVPLITDAELLRLDIAPLVETARSIGIDVMRFPINDGSIPKDEDAAAQFIDEIVERLRRGNNVVVHCNGGLGRAGTVCSCVSLRLGLDQTAAAAIARVRAARSPRAVETREQEEFIERFAQRVARPTRMDRVRGAWLGLATGDALGAPVEFMDAASIALRFGRWDEMRPGGPWKKGETTDDTALTLCTAKAYTEDGFILERAASAMVDWLRSEPKDVGNLTRHALGLISSGSATATNAGEIASQGRQSSAGNGALMRCASTAIVRRPRDSRLIDETSSLSRITHADERSVSACIAYNVVLAALLAGDAPHEALARVAEQENLHADVQNIVSRISNGQPARFRNSDGIGFVLLSFEWALESLRDATDFATALVELIQRGGDTDTNAAIAGALLGARFGVSAIPERWLGAVLDRDVIEGALTQLIVFGDGQ